MTKLSERAMLVGLHIGTYSGMQFDKLVSEEISASYKADVKKAGRFNKRLIDSRFLAGVSGAHFNARTTHKLLTLPWEDDGTRILTTAAYIEYVRKMKEARARVENEVKEFVKGLPEYITEARIRLGNMFVEEDYPTEDELRSKFKYDVEVKPLPEASDFRAQLSDEATKHITKDIERRINRKMETAINDIFERVAERVGALVKKLREYQPASGDQKANGVLRTELVHNIYEFANMMPLLNVTDDPRVNALQKQLVDELVEFSPVILRTDAKIRAQVLSNADKILRKVQGYMK